MPVMSREEEGELVGEGSFKVDPDRALRILRERQLDPELPRLGLWVRAAAARRASRIEFVWKTTELFIRFDGRPFSVAELADPFSGLLEGECGEAARWFALALLHTALPGVSVFAETGPAGSRRAVLLDGKGIRLRPPSIGGEGTAVCVSWPFFLSGEGPEHPSRWARRVLTMEALAACPVRISVRREGEDKSLWTFTPLKPNARRANVARLRREGADILLCVVDGPPGLRVRAAPAGVSLEWSAELPFPVALRAWVDDPGLALDASLRGPAQDEGLQRALTSVREEAGRFLESALSRHRRAMGLAGGLLATSPALAKRWGKQMGGEGSRGLSLTVGWVNTWLPFRPRLSGDAKRVDECARMTKLLREAALAPSGAGVRFFWKTPLFFDDRGRPLSLEDVQAFERLLFWDGPQPAPDHRPGRVWALSPSDPLFLHAARSPRLAGPSRT